MLFYSPGPGEEGLLQGPGYAGLRLPARGPCRVGWGLASLDLYPEKPGEGEGAPRGPGLGEGLVQEVA